MQQVIHVVDAVGNQRRKVFHWKHEWAVVTNEDCVILDVIFFNDLLFNKINLVNKKLVCDLICSSIVLIIFIIPSYLEKISPWCLNNVSTMRLIRYDRI